MWYVYLLRCSDGSLYTGITNDLAGRMDAHRSGDGSKYVRSRGYDQLLYAVHTGTQSEAARLEHLVKQLDAETKQPWFMDHDRLAYHALTD